MWSTPRSKSVLRMLGFDRPRSVPGFASSTRVQTKARWEVRDDIHEAFLTLGCALICWRRLAQLQPQSRLSKVALKPWS